MIALFLADVIKNIARDTFSSNQKYNQPLSLPLKVMLHGMIGNITMQCWNNVAIIQNNIATMLQRCVALKIVVANRFV